MAVVIIYLVLGAILLVKGADLLVDGGVGIALKSGISELVVGLTVVAFGTSAPELTVSLTAAITGSGAISYTNVVGSNIANIALILGITAIIAPIAVNRSLIRWELPFMIGISLITAVIGYKLAAPRIAGLILLALFVWYMRHCLHSPEPPGELPEGYAQKSAWLLVGMIILGTIGLAGGGKLFVDAAVEIALALGISESKIGLTVVALGTSLPELVTSVVAALKKQADISLGNIVGSNIFNILMVLGATAVISPFTLEPDQYLFVAGIPIMLLTAVILVPFALSGRVINRIEGSVLVAIYAVTMVLAVILG